MWQKLKSEEDNKPATEATATARAKAKGGSSVSQAKQKLQRNCCRGRMSNET